MAPLFFATPAAWRKWLEANHAKKSELLVGFHKTSTGKACMTWSESVDEALCFGWIDGVRRSAGDTAYTIRFTPRTASSNWSLVNLRRMKTLIAEGRAKPAGLRAFEARRDDRTGVYSFEQQRNPKLLPAEERRLRENRDAWAFFQAQPPGYRRVVTFWVVSAKREDARERRLAQLIRDSAAGQRVGLLRRS